MSIIVFVVAFALTILLQQWLHKHIQGFGLALTGNPGCAVRLLFFLLLPGVILHELSHYLVARLLFVRASPPKIGVGQLRGRMISLGSVNIQRTDPIRESLIGVAPFVMGIGAIWLIAGYGFDLWPSGGLSIGEFVKRVQLYANDWTTWLDVYLIFAVSTAMIPSQSDRQPWGPVITVLGLVTALLLLFGWTPSVPAEIVALARSLLDALTLALGIAVIVNAFVAAVILAMELTIFRFNGRRAEYRARHK